MNMAEYEYQHVELSMERTAEWERDGTFMYVLSCWGMGMASRDAETDEWLDPDESYEHPTFLDAFLALNEFIKDDMVDPSDIDLEWTQPTITRDWAGDRHDHILEAGTDAWIRVEGKYDIWIYHRKDNPGVRVEAYNVGKHDEGLIEHFTLDR